MKKNYLFLLALICSASSIFSQSYVVQTPIYDGSSTRISGPSGHATQKYQRSVFLVTQTELALMSLTDNTITAFGFDMRFGTSIVAAAGNFTLHLENTTDVAYSKGLNFTTALTGMQQCYAGPMTIPLATGFTTMGVTLGNTFAYTGGGIYVAYDWVANAPSVNEQNGAWTLAHSSDLTPGGATCEGTALPAAATMTNSDFRPVFRFVAGNIAQNDVAVLRMDAPGIVAKLLNAPQVITAQVKNQSSVALANINVSLTVAGANTFNNVQTLSLAAGATTLVSFAPFNPMTSGINNMTVQVASDDNDFNNGFIWTQSVTCADIAHNPPVAASSFSENALGFNTAGIISSKYQVPTTCSLSIIKLAMANTTINLGKQTYGVLMDAGGNIIATSNTITVNGAALGAFVNFTFSPAEALTPNVDYYLGIAIPVGPMYPMGTNVFDPYVKAVNYYAGGINGGSVPSQADRGFMGVQAVLSFSNTEISAMASPSLICKQDGPLTVTLTASGLSTFTWAPGGQGATIVVTPTLSQASGTVNYNVTGTDAATGCKSRSMQVKVTVSECTALSSNTSGGYDLKLFPNPSVNGKSNITGLAGKNTITIYNTLGQIVATQITSDESTTIDLSNQPSGNYLVKITNTLSESRTIKVVNQN